MHECLPWLILVALLALALGFGLCRWKANRQGLEHKTVIIERFDPPQNPRGCPQRPMPVQEEQAPHDPQATF